MPRRERAWHIREAAKRALGLGKAGQQGTGKEAGEAGARAPWAWWNEGACHSSETEQKTSRCGLRSLGVLPAVPLGTEGGQHAGGGSGSAGRARCPGSGEDLRRDSDVLLGVLWLPHSADASRRSRFLLLQISRFKEQGGTAVRGSEDEDTARCAGGDTILGYDTLDTSWFLSVFTSGLFPAVNTSPKPLAP